MRALFLLVLLASGAAAQEASCDGDALLLERAPTLHQMLRDPAWVEVILSSPVEEYQGDVREAASLMGEYACHYVGAVAPDDNDPYLLLFVREQLVALLSEPVGIWSAALEWESFAGTEGPAMRAAFASEVEALGFRPVYAEGTLVALSYGAMEFGADRGVAHDLALYVDVQEALGRLTPSDLDVGDLRAEADVLGRAEQLLTRYPSSAFGERVRPPFARALSLLASLHPVAGAETWQVGVGGANGLPFGGDRQALVYFLTTYPESKYVAVFERLLAFPPLAIPQGDLDVIVVGSSGSSEGATALSQSMLDAGIDVVGPVQLVSQEWGVAFRYYPADDPRLVEAEARARDLGLTPSRERVDAGRLNRIDWR